MKLIATLFAVSFLLENLILCAPSDHLDQEIRDFIKRNGFSEDHFESVHISELCQVQDDQSCKPFDHEEYRHRRDADAQTIFHIHTPEDNYILQLTRQRSVLNPRARVFVYKGENKQQWNGSVLPCFLVGQVKSHGGSASFSFCHGLRGSMVIDDFEYLIEPLRGGQQHIIAKRKADKITDYDEILVPDDGLELEPQHTTSVNKSGPVTIEIALYMDKDMTAFLEQHGADTLTKKINYILVKWNGVQYEYAKKEQLGYDVILDIKKMTFFSHVNPSWYKSSSRLGSMLYSTCRWQADKEPFDHVYIHTGRTHVSPLGVAYVNGVCSRRIRCAVSADRGWGGYAAEAHELGHSLKMHHDTSTACGHLPKGLRGLMGGMGTNFSNCSIAAFHSLIQYLSCIVSVRPEITKRKPSLLFQSVMEKFRSSHSNCLFKENINTTQPELVSMKPTPLLPGMYKSPDEICEESQGAGYRYLELVGHEVSASISCNGHASSWIPVVYYLSEHSSNTSKDQCNSYLCVQTRPGPNYGLLGYFSSRYNGKYCGSQKACMRGKCLPWSSLLLHLPLKIQNGGWSAWQPHTTCSQSCGIGVKLSHRLCNNPKPINAEGCVGNAYRAELCNTQPCADESKVIDDLIIHRAGKVCERLIDHGFLNSTLFHKKGHQYSTQTASDVCEVKCERANRRRGYRNAILPDGTPCKIPDPKYHISGTSGLHYHCLQGTCQTFGCDGKFPPAQHGNSTSCKLIIVGW